MKNKIISATLVILLLISGITYVKAEENEVVIHVSVTGDDSLDGTEDKPLKSLDGARGKVRQIKKQNPETAVKVIFHEGRYRFNKTVAFDKNDSGTEEKPVIYEGAEGENVEFVGSIAIDISTLKPVRDKNIKKRLKPGVADYVGEINLRDFGINNVAEFLSNGYTEAKQEYAGLYLDGKEQPLAQFPNGFGNYAYWQSVPNTGGTGFKEGQGGTIIVADEEVRRWNNLDNVWISGYFGYDYRMERIAVESVDTSKKAIKFAAGSDLGIINKESKRWKAFNLLEELDEPGEWYIDQKTMMLYYYPPYNIKGAELELSVLSGSFISTNQAENIVFKNITFANAKGRGISFGSGTRNITVMNCTFKNISKTAVYAGGSTRSAVFEEYMNYLDAASKIIIKNNIFYNIGGSAIDFVGPGNRQTLTMSECEITNNYIEKVSQLAKNLVAVNLTGGMGTKIENNTIHTIPFHAINFQTQDSSIKYNDVSNACMETTDAAVIYAGRSFIRMNNEVAYNYVHNYSIKGEGMHLNQVPGIYLDDHMSGVNMHHNIFESGGIGIYINKGLYNQIKDNIFVDVDRPFKNTPGGDPGSTVINNAKAALTFPGWNERYPMIQKIIDNPKQSAYNEITGNVTPSEIKFESAVKELNTVENNIIHEGKDIFVNPEGNDYRLKSESEVAKQLPNVLNDKNFELSKIGIQESAGIEYPEGEFKKIYPANGDYNIDSSNVEFKWEDAMGAEEYRLVIAKDPEMKEIVHDKIYYYSFADVDVLESRNSVYYYTVFARRNVGGFVEWESMGVPYRFSTSKYGCVNISELNDTVTYIEKIVSGIKEGEDVGLYKIGTIDKISEYLNEAKKMQTWESEKDGTQADIDKVSYELADAVSEKNIHTGYLGIESMVKDRENWVLDRGGESVIECDGETVTLKSEKGSAVAMYKETQSVMASRNTVRKFQAKFDLSKGWTGLGLRTVAYDYAEKMYVTANPCYFFAIKPDLIEFQKMPGGIIKEIPNTFIKDGEWHEIEFGVLNSESCPVVIFNVDGENLIEYYDNSTSQKFEEGAFSVSLSSNKYISLKPSEEMGKEYPYSHITEKKNYDYVVYQADSKIAWKGTDIEELTDNMPVYRNNEVYLPLRATAEAFGMKVTWNDEGYALVSSGKKNIKVFPKENICDVNDFNKTLNSKIIKDRGHIKLSTSDLAWILDVEYKIYDKNIVSIGKNLNSKEIENAVNKIISGEESDGNE